MSDCKKRDPLLDFIKGFLIILVVIGHCIECGSGNQFRDSLAHYDNWLHHIIYSFHMPLFTLISGYLFYSSCQRNCYKTIIKNKVYTLLLPLLTWIIVSRFGLLFVNLFIKHQIMNFNISSIIFSFLHGLIYNFWFLKTIFFSSMLIIFVKRFFSDKIFIHLLIFLILLFTPPVADSAYHIFMYPYFVSGYYFKKYKSIKIEEIINNYFYVIFCILLFFWIFLLLNYNRSSYIYTTGISLFNNLNINMISIIIYRFLIGYIGSICIILLSIYVTSRIKVNKLNRLIQLLGKSSLGIYIISVELNPFLEILTASKNGVNYIILLIESTTIIMISVLLFKCICKNSVLGFLFFGKKNHENP